MGARADFFRARAIDAPDDRIGESHEHDADKEIDRQATNILTALPAQPFCQNGAAAAGLLTSYGSIVDNTHAHVEVHTVSAAMVFFGVGVGAAVLASILAYATQRILVTVSSVRLELSLTAPALSLAIASSFFAGVMQASTALA